MLIRYILRNQFDRATKRRDEKLAHRFDINIGTFIVRNYRPCDSSTMSGIRPATHPHDDQQRYLSRR